jgi:hypothetical protein
VRAFEASGVYCIESRCVQHNTIVHDRLLLLRPGQWLVILDVYGDAENHQHNVRQRFHLAPGHNAVCHPDGFDVALRGGGNLLVRQLLEGHTAPDMVVSGSKDPKIQGWFSDRERSATPSDALSFVQSGRSAGVFATLLTLSPSNCFSSKFGRSDITGQQAKYGWTDQSGRHRISIARGDKLGPLARLLSRGSSVRYKFSPAGRSSN